MDQSLRIGVSSIAGNGVFAVRDFDEGQSIFHLVGERCTLEEILARAQAGTIAGSDPLGIDTDVYLILDDFSRTFNHSCGPNAFLANESDLIALRPIDAGEEITFDYSTTMNDNEQRIVAAGRTLWVCPCNCASLECRRTIDQFKTLPPKIKNSYIRRRQVPAFMLRAFA